jgi:uncharacterized protein (UPF0335 family)
MAKKKKDATTGHNSGEAILGYVERIEKLEETKAAAGEDIKLVKQQAKSEGFDASIIADLVKIRKDEKKAKERLQLLDRYASAIQLHLFSEAA